MAEDPKHIDHFEILRELGRGGMGKVYLARDLWLERQVAIKVVSLEDPKTEQERRDRDALAERLMREAKIAAALDHPGIVTIYQVGLHGNQPYIAMQFVDGQALDALLKENTPFDPVETIRILKDVAAALDHAHEMGVIHRDVKPANIMLSRHRTVKICDFGIAKFAMLPRKTSSVLMGTPHYMAPEQLTYKPVDRRTDQWALGVVAYRMLTGRLPFRAEDMESLASQIIFRPLPSAREFDESLSPRVTGVLERALSKDPAGRYPACADFLADLAAAVESPSPATADDESAFVRGLRYEEGLEGTPQDYARALGWYRKAAEDGDSRGMMALGFMYENGRGGLPKDDAQALSWYRQAADAGNPGAMTNLGHICAKGLLGVPIDKTLATSWFLNAAGAGEISAMTILGAMYAKGEGGLPKDEEQSVSWFRKADQFRRAGKAARKNEWRERRN